MSSDGNNWKEKLTQYKYPSSVKDDVHAVLSSYTELKPKIENFTFNDGKSCDLLCLAGTIPVMYLSVVYHIPIAVFLYESHPYSAPMVYVRPTSTMQIKPTKFVDNTGLVSLPYLSDWKHPESDLIGLLGVLQSVFGQCSPVFAKTPAPTPSVSYPCPVPGPTMPLFYPQPPLLTNPDNTYLLPQMPGIGWQIPQLSNMGHMQLPQLPVYTSSFPDLPPPVIAPTSTSGVTDSKMNVVSNDHLLLSLRSAVADRIRRVQTELICQYGDEMKAIQQAQSDLQHGGQKLQNMLARMSQEESTATAALEQLTKKNSELSDLVQRLSTSENDPINVDEAVNTTFPLYRQLLSSFAEEQAIEDTIYYLGKALGKGVLDLDVFLKKVRELSRKQFMLRATVQLCREKAGLPIY